jgi:two-component system LytT family response regulator
MEKVRIIVAEDDEASRKVIVRLLEALPYIEVVAEAKDGQELIRQILTEEPNLVLLDINMPKINGIHAIRECMKTFPEINMIIISGHPEYAIDAFNLSAIDYLMKPVERVRLYQAIEKARQLIQKKKEEEWKQLYKLKTSNEKLVVHAEGMIYFLQLKDVFFIEKVGRKTLLHTANQKIEILGTLGGLLERLDPSVFFQTHRSYIINFNQVSCIQPSGDTNLVYFHDYKEPAYISKNRMNDLLKFLK